MSATRRWLHPVTLSDTHWQYLLDTLIVPLMNGASPVVAACAPLWGCALLFIRMTLMRKMSAPLFSSCARRHEVSVCAAQAILCHSDERSASVELRLLGHLMCLQDRVAAERALRSLSVAIQEPARYRRSGLSLLVPPARFCLSHEGRTWCPLRSCARWPTLSGACIPAILRSGSQERSYTQVCCPGLAVITLSHGDHSQPAGCDAPGAAAISAALHGRHTSQGTPCSSRQQSSVFRGGSTGNSRAIPTG
jgi:hypothetical protein